MGLNKAQRAAIELRRLGVAASLLAGRTYREMAAENTCSIGTIAHDVSMILAAWRDEQSRMTDQIISIELARLDRALSSIWDAAVSGNLGAVDRLLRISERRAKLLGLDAPTRIVAQASWRQELKEAGMNPDQVLDSMIDAIVASMGGHSD